MKKFKPRKKKLDRRPITTKPSKPALNPLNYEAAKAVYNTPSYKAWREYVFHRDQYICQMCGKGGQLEAHHVKPKKLFPELTLDPDNGITLCKSCHQDIVTRREDRFCFIFTRVIKLNTKRLEIRRTPEPRIEENK